MNRPTLRRKRVLLPAAGLLLAGAWLGISGWRISQSLAAAQLQVVSLDVRNLASAESDATLSRVTRHVDSAASVARDPLWRLAGAVPWLGQSFSVTTAATEEASGLLHDVAPQLVDVALELRQNHLLRNGRVNLPLVQRLAGPLATAESAARASSQRLRRQPHGALPGPVSRRYDGLADATDRLAKGLGTAAEAAEVAPEMLGSKGTRRYFLAIQNNAESRATGGLIGAYAILRADQGRLTRERIGIDSELLPAASPVVDLGPEFADHYDFYGSRADWRAATLTPDWPSAARILRGLWARQSGQTVDGVIGVDVLAMRDILSAIGPARLGERVIGAHNVVEFVMRDEYNQFVGRDTERKQLLAALAAAIYDRVAVGSDDPHALLRAFGRAAGSGHLQVWSQHPGEERILAAAKVGGALRNDHGRFLHVVTQNAAGNKADYYVRRAVSCRVTGGAEMALRLRLTNLMDPARVPDIVKGRLDMPTFDVEPGQTRLLVSLYVGARQEVTRVMVDGRLLPAEEISVGGEKGLPWVTFQVEVSPRRATVISAVIKGGEGPLSVRQQPLVVDDSLDMDGCLQARDLG